MATSPSAQDSRQLRRVAVSSYLGTTIEYYDFLLYGTVAALVFNKVLFANEDVEALDWIQQYMERDARPGVVEQSVPADVPGLRFRRLLHRLAANEQR